MNAPLPEFAYEYSLEKPFLAIHKDGEILCVCGENEKGFLHMIPFWPAMGIDGPPAYCLKKSHWKRMIFGE
jgi:hypothetical protein